MTQATFINLKALSSTREVKFAQRARESVIGNQKSRHDGHLECAATTAAALDNSPTPLPDGSAVDTKRTSASLFEGQIPLTLVDEGRKFFWPSELLRCPRCLSKPALEADWEPITKRPRYRVHCSNTQRVPVLTQPPWNCDQPIGAWFTSNRDAIRCWNLAVKLAQ
jgi:hypothetical protein